MEIALRTADQLRDHIRGLRRLAKLTQKGLGVRLGLGQVRIAEIEASPGSISTEQLLQILHALGAELVIRPKPTGLQVTQDASTKRNEGSW